MRRAPLLATARLVLAGCALAGCAAVATEPPAVPILITPTPTKAPSPSPQTKDLVFDKFVERFTAADFTAHVVIDAGVAVAGGTATFDATIDVHGPDSRAAMTSNVEGSKLAFDAVVVKGVSYTQLDGAGYARNATYRESFAINPFFHLGADIRRLKYVGIKTGTELHDIRLDGAFIIHPVNLGPTNISEPRLQYSEYHILVSTDGVPVSGTLRFIGAARVGRQLQELKIDANYTFTQVGEPIVVEVPA